MRNFAPSSPPLIPPYPFMNAESGMARSVCGYAKAESSAIGITLGRRMAIKRRYRNCTFWNCSSQYILPLIISLLLARSIPTIVEPGKRAPGYICDRGHERVRRGRKGEGNRERMSLRCFRIPESIPRHRRTITSFRLPPVWDVTKALLSHLPLNTQR